MQQRFVAEYLADPNPKRNAKAAALRAGYSKSSAGPHSCRMLQDPEIQELINKELTRHLEKLDVDAQMVLKESSTRLTMPNTPAEAHGRVPPSCAAMSSWDAISAYSTIGSRLTSIPKSWRGWKRDEDGQPDLQRTTRKKPKNNPRTSPSPTSPPRNTQP